MSEGALGSYASMWMPGGGHVAPPASRYCACSVWIASGKKCNSLADCHECFLNLLFVDLMWCWLCERCISRLLLQMLLACAGVGASIQLWRLGCSCKLAKESSNWPMTSPTIWLGTQAQSPVGLRLLSAVAVLQKCRLLLLGQSGVFLRASSRSVSLSLTC